MPVKKNKKLELKSSNVPVIQSQSPPSFRNRNAPMDSLMDRFWDRDLFSERPFEQMGMIDRDARKMFIRPRSDFWETEKEVGLTLDVPGVDRKDILLNISPHAIEVRAEKRESKEEKQTDLYRMERSYSGFYRSFPIPSNVDATKARARYENGVLKIIVPKSRENTARGRIIKVD